MISKIYHIVLLFVLLNVPLFLWAQETQVIGIEAKAKVSQGRIYLRWAPENAVSWQLANKYGYTIERFRIMQNGRLVDSPERKVLLPYALKPSPLENWEPYSDDDYVGVAAQAIYGESFEVEEPSATEMMRVINASRELENRFSFALYAADMSIKAAELSGLFVSDQEVYAGEKYVYKIYVSSPVATHVSDTASIYIGLADEVPLPQPFDVKVAFEDQVSVISWNAQIHQKVYNTYWVERSDDGTSFKSITDVPIVSTYQRNPSERIYKGDSLSANGIRYYYRVIGVDAFGFEGPPSEIVDGTGLPVFKIAPTIASHEISETQEVTLYWKVPQVDLSLLHSFSISRESGSTGFNAPIANDLPAKTRQFTDSLPHSSNYYIVTAHDDYGRKIASFPYMVQLDDSIPPSRPVGLKGSISDLGIVSLTWDENTESDLRGYKVYKSNYADEDGFIELPGQMVTQALVEDSIALDNLTEKIYYRVKAFDKRQNPSEFSDIIELKKPDLIPPVSPVFTNIKNDSLGILVQWENSPSEDMELQLLYRRAADQSDWELVYTQQDGFTFYLDEESEHNTRYAYTLIAVDDDGLESLPAKPVTMLRKKLNPYPSITSLNHVVDQEKKTIVLSWSYNQDDVVKYRLYKSVGDSALQLYKELPVAQSVSNQFVDQYTGDSQLAYSLQAVFESGEMSVLSKKLNVEL
ncbi:hypothetical protein N6H18_06800 [Reichenbachiella agarivorans]|uniref:Fibronectin type-III domain-containing protein n=1 Tax=Reichenbachiella agarivorans TaxID=2979464 RepID=A0ABY6CZJ6_9BACT|nr:hypothetical protein [Reichenbachiella agarivorans]UXP33660.1 hypothetical protein N6H18_06800 [Reichenbachiella agarivorans]